MPLSLLVCEDLQEARTTPACMGWREEKGEEIYNNVHFHQCTHPHTHTRIYTNTLERHGAVVSWQTNDRQMTCWNTSTRPDSNRPVRLCQWHILWRERERGEREPGLCVILHKQNLCQTPDVIASTAVNCVQSNLSVNLGCRESGHG